MVKVVRKPGPGMEKLQSFLHGLGKGAVARVGWLDSKKYENGFPVAAAAALNEFGSPSKNIPPRSFMRTTAKEQENNWRKICQDGAQRMLDSNVSIGAVMEGLGLQAAGDIRKKIAEIQSPPLKPATIKARRRKMADGKTIGKLDKPLIESGIMINSLTHEVSAK